MIDLNKPWMQTHSGRRFPLIEPTVADVHWPDIAYHLAHTNRFCGAAGGYTVAQHTVFALRWVTAEVQPYWLLHDAHEAYMGDLIRPAVAALDHLATDAAIIRPAVRALKEGIDRAIYAAAGLSPPSESRTQLVEYYDTCMLLTECRDLLGDAAADWGLDPTALPFPGTLARWSAETAYNRFGHHLSQLFGIGLPPMYEIAICGDRQ